MSKNIVDYLRAFRHINKKDADKVFDACRQSSFKRGEWIFRAGMLGNKLYYIDKGILKITSSDEQGNDFTYFFMKENQFMGFLYSMYGNVPAQQGLQAATDVELSVIEKDTLFSLYEELPYLKELIDLIAHLSMSEMIHMKNNYIVGTASEKYKLFLKRQPEIALHAMQIDIASYLSIAPQSLSRIRKKIR